MQFGDNDIDQVIRDGSLILDVRAPAEFAQGHMPGSVNIPILNDAERRQVGIAYKHEGNAAATALGHKLVAGDIREVRVKQWQQFCEARPDAYICCWRGGQRSQLAQAWLHAEGVDRPRIKGGFKALRQRCLEILQNPNKTWWILGGRTGSAKTAMIQQLPNSIDLEGAAQHRGSAFGRRKTPQPSLVAFENDLAGRYLRHTGDHLVVEDESRTIGQLGLPERWHRHMQQAPVVIVEVPAAERIGHIKAEYVDEPLNTQSYTPGELEASFLDALSRIAKRLGGDRFATAKRHIEAAFTGAGSHEAWIEYLLREYYDPMYDYQLNKKSERIVFRGERGAVMDYLGSRHAESIA